MKITKKQLKQLILEEIGGMPRNAGEGNVYPGYGYMQNFPKGEPPDNQKYEIYKGREPHETGEMPKPALKDGQKFVTQGKNVYVLVFNKDSKNLSGKVEPVGEYKFTIDPAGPCINWEGETPANVRFDANLEKQILEFRGTE